MIDFEKDFIVLKPNSRSSNEYGINILESGKINLNGKLNRDLKEREAELLISKDCNIFVINPNGNLKHKIPKNGSIKNKDVCDLLRNKKKKFPVHYNVKWDQEQKVWIGTTETVGKIMPEK